ncbi:MAG: SMR family transporter [bacterium]
MSALMWLLFGGSILTVGDIIFKFWANKSLTYLYITGLVIYVLGLMCLVQSFKSQNIAVASAIFVIVNVVTLSLVSYFYFKESLSVLQMVGIGVAFVSIMLMELGGK